jgi:hypothetical protein
MEFPLFRKYSHDRTFFKINSPNDFEELTIIGTWYIYRHFEVKIFSDRVFIQDMIVNDKNHWIESSDEEFQLKKTFCLTKLQAL